MGKTIKKDTCQKPADSHICISRPWNGPNQLLGVVRFSASLVPQMPSNISWLTPADETDFSNISRVRYSKSKHLHVFGLLIIVLPIDGFHPGKTHFHLQDPKRLKSVMQILGFDLTAPQFSIVWSALLNLPSNEIISSRNWCNLSDLPL
jgi:hypothetical protein